MAIFTLYRAPRKFADEASSSTPTSTTTSQWGHDAFVFASNAQPALAYTTTADFVEPHSTTIAGMSALWTSHHDASGAAAVVPDTAYDAITHWSPHSNFHLV